MPFNLILGIIFPNNHYVEFSLIFILISNDQSLETFIGLKISKNRKKIFPKTLIHRLI
jgi:hypothetical protein